MSFRVDKVNGICYHTYDKPEVICFRDVVDDALVSYWYEWQGISQNISMEQFFREVEKCGLSPEKLSIKAWEDENGVIIDYGVRHQFWIPRSVINNNEWDLEYLRTSLGDRLDNQDIGLKPCPFCGGKAKIMVAQELRLGGDEGFVIQCEDCYMNTASINGTYSSNSTDVIELWNRRVFKETCQNKRNGEKIMNRNKKGVMPEVTREVYKNVKKYDRQQFAGFCTELYKYGYEDGRESVPGVDPEEVMAAVAQARGVGKRTLDNIRDCVERLFRKDEENE